MNSHLNPNLKIPRPRLFLIAFILGSCWSILIGGFLAWEIKSQQDSINDLAAAEARASFNKDLVYRRWASGHGGVYVPVSDEMPPNPYLSHVNERDITTPSGKKLTLINPAYMTRQAHDLGKKQYGVQGHITSLNPIRPENKPDQWETKALKSFRNGASEFSSISTINDIEYMRVMYPMITEKKCLKCHGYQGYKVDDIRGGISVSVPLTLYKAVAKENISKLIFIHISIFCIGIISLGITFLHISKKSRERDAIEKSLHESEEHLRGIFNAAENVAIVTTDLGGTETIVTGFSPGAEKIFGTKIDEVIGKKVAMFHPPEIVEDFPIMQNDLRKNGLGYSGEAILIRKSGEPFPALFSIYPKTDGSGKLTGTIGVSIDISERKQAENKHKKAKELFEKVFNSQHDAIFILNAETPVKVLECNKATETIFGYSMNELIGTDTSYLHVDADHLNEFQNNLFPAIAKEGVLKNFNFKMQRKNGSIFPSEHMVMELKNGDGGRTGWISIVRDLTEQKEMEDRILQAQKMESIGNLAGGIAHDFNNILFPILGMAELLLEDLPTNSIEYENAQEIFTAGKRGSDLVKQILSFSRQHEHKLIPTRIEKVLREVMKLSRSTIPINIEIREDIDQNCGFVMADATQIHQVLMNLITNAYHAIDTINGIIDIQLKNVELEKGEIPDSLLQSGKYIKLSVADDGAGMPPNVQNKIFDPYFTTKERGKGTGLGLAVVYGIIKEHNGDIKVYSEEGKGSTFNIYLPLKKSVAKSSSEGKIKKMPTGVEKILLVDDEPSIAKLEAQILSRLGYQVTQKTNSTEALGEFKTNPDNFDLVITDMTMPGMTGDQLAREILSIKPEIPIIICTGFSERVNKEQAEFIGVKGFLMKPVVKFDIAEMVRKVLDGAKIS